MGLLTLGQPLTWDETRKYAEHVREHGIQQFIHAYHRLKDRQDEYLKWGDEIEYMLIKFDSKQEKARVCLKAGEILSIMDEREAKEGDKRTCLWRPEFGAFMVEGTPGMPYGASDLDITLLSNFNEVEKNMKIRRKEVESLLSKDEALLCITSFPRLGCKDFTWPLIHHDPAKSVTGSIFFPDKAIYQGHPRFRTIAQNIRSRRKRRVIINIPIYRDVKTPDPFIEDFTDNEAKQAIKADHVYMDAMGFGMGCCCLQVTFQASNLDEARILYDQLTPLCPIMMALSAASPIQRGHLCDLDCRWSVISQAVDDRTKEELGEEPLKFSKFRISKSRYDSIDSYISQDGSKYNDIQLTYDQVYYQKMVTEGVDPLIAKHIAHLFIRDPITLYREKIDQDDEKEMDHFENIQSTNWQTMRFKPPPPSAPGIGWRVEFRPMEVQITEFENAALVVFVVLLTRIILSYRLNLLLPISKVDENMKEAQKRDAVQRCRFWFRKRIITHTSPPEASACLRAASSSETNPSDQNCKQNSNRNPNNNISENDIDESCVLLTIDEIINGKSGEFPGLVPLLKHYLLSVEIDAETHCTISQYLNLISSRASGKYLTTAQWIRHFVQSHTDYKKDSVVTDKINYDLLKTIKKITKGKILCEDLVGNSSYIKERLLSHKI
ncbi:glutamate--cysteine ligase catalytic subunit-like [Panonychus citri]|uniref:glutamate--cysteine ligase catalytic subunit-like n=1 Tax=Panonychus citri TaxID=50023 RepID=UPI0023072218|nr:glutamate--cysteine ligase catalytic subunit-like [Panonychus citri]